MSWFGKLAKFAGTGLKFLPVPGAGVVGDVISGAGSALSGASDAMASNRSAKLDYALLEEQARRQREQGAFEQAAAREQDKRAGGDAAWRALQQAEYVKGAKDYKPAAGLKSFGFGPKVSQAEKDAASHRASEANRRLVAEDSLLGQPMQAGFSLDKKLMNPSGWERVAGIAGLGLEGLSAGQQLTVLEALRRKGIPVDVDPNDAERG